MGVICPHQGAVANVIANRFDGKGSNVMIGFELRFIESLGSFQRGNPWQAIHQAIEFDILVEIVSQDAALFIQPYSSRGSESPSTFLGNLGIKHPRQLNDRFGER
jgi:hypothetical protein